MYFYQTCNSMKQQIIHRLVVYVFIFDSMTEPETMSAPHYVTLFTVQILQASVMNGYVTLPHYQIQPPRLPFLSLFSFCLHLVLLNFNACFFLKSPLTLTFIYFTFI